MEDFFFWDQPKWKINIKHIIRIINIINSLARLLDKITIKTNFLKI